MTNLRGRASARFKGYEDPSDLALRSWIRGLSPEQIHREVRERLADREALVIAALRRWPPDWPLTFDAFLACLERITIDLFPITGEGEGCPALPFGALGQPGVQERLSLEDEEALLVEACLNALPPWPEETKARIRPVIRRIQRRFLDSACTPLPRQLERLDEYETVLKLLQSLRRPREPFRRTFKLLLLNRGRSLMLGARNYQVPDEWERRLSRRAPPHEIARLLLSDRWGKDMQAVKELVAAMKKERAIGQAWNPYRKWLLLDPRRGAALLAIVKTFRTGASVPPPV